MTMYDARNEPGGAGGWTRWPATSRSAGLSASSRAAVRVSEAPSYGETILQYARPTPRRRLSIACRRACRPLQRPGDPPMTRRGLGRGLDRADQQNGPRPRRGAQGTRTFASSTSTGLFPTQAAPPTGRMDETELAELASLDSPRHGLIQPIVIHPGTAGSPVHDRGRERRWRAARVAGLTQVPVVVSSRQRARPPYAGDRGERPAQRLEPHRGDARDTVTSWTSPPDPAQVAELIGKSAWHVPTPFGFWACRPICRP